MTLENGLFTYRGLFVPNIIHVGIMLSDIDNISMIYQNITRNVTDFLFAFLLVPSGDTGGTQTLPKIVYLAEFMNWVIWRFF